PPISTLFPYTTLFRSCLIGNRRLVESLLSCKSGLLPFKITSLPKSLYTHFLSFFMAEKLTFTFLGTSSAIPTERRNHTGMLLQYKGEHIMIDCGEGTQRQLRIAKLSPAKINRIL